MYLYNESTQCVKTKWFQKINGAQTRNRTKDTRIFSPLLYQLSYLGKHCLLFNFKVLHDRRLRAVFYVRFFHPRRCNAGNLLWWAIRDSNPGPAGYEPDALTNWANGPHIQFFTLLVGVAGFEPAAHWSQTSCATKLRYTPILFSPYLAGAVGFEPTARGFGDHCSTNWAIPL